MRSPGYSKTGTPSRCTRRTFVTIQTKSATSRFLYHVVEESAHVARNELHVICHFALDPVRCYRFHAESLLSQSLHAGAEIASPRESVTGRRQEQGRPRGG